MRNMWKKETRTLFKDWSARTAVVLMFLLTSWWLVLHLFFPDATFAKMIWGASYQLMSLIGGLWGLKIAFDWGGEKSVVGRLLVAFGVGLLLQTFGQSVFSVYNLFLQYEIPYPSLADVGFFGSIVFYIYGAVMLAGASGVRFSFATLKSRPCALAIPVIMILLPYLLFLRGYDFQDAGIIQSLLDFGYPIGQAIYVSIALLTYLLTLKTLGGVMKHRVLFILLALAVQYLADFNFLYQASAGNWGVSGYGDLIYLVAYFLMALGIIQMQTRFVMASES